MLVSRRRRSMDYYYTPALESTTRPKRHPPARCLAAGSESCDGQPRSLTRGDADSSTSEMLKLMMMMSGADTRRCNKSSRGSCGAWSMRSLLDRCPASPSPVLSAVSLSCSPPQPSDDAHSFFTPDQLSSCVVKSTEGKKSTRERANLEGSRKPSNASRHYPIFQPIVDATTITPMRNKRDGERSAGQMLAPKPATLSEGSFKTAGLRFLCKPSESFCASSSENDDDRRLLAVSEGRKNPGLCSDDGDYMPSSEDGYDKSDIESVIEEQLRAVLAPSSPSRSFARERKRAEDEVGYLRLTAWKEAKTLKLMNKLRDEEVAIDKWAKSKATKAKMDVKELEMKLEKQRSKAMEKMQRKIRHAQKAAEKKKLNEQAATDRKISRVGKVFDKIAGSGKIPWMLILC